MKMSLLPMASHASVDTARYDFSTDPARGEGVDVHIMKLSTRQVARATLPFSDSMPISTYGDLKIASFVRVLYGARLIGKSNTNNLPAPTDLTENPYYGGKSFLRCNSKLGLPPWYHAKLK
jgi:hypothetical protein